MIDWDENNIDAMVHAPYVACQSSNRRSLIRSITHNMSDTQSIAEASDNVISTSTGTEPPVNTHTAGSNILPIFTDGVTIGTLYDQVRDIHQMSVALNRILNKGWQCCSALWSDHRVQQWRCW